MKNILVHARELSGSTAACRYGAQIAKAFGGSLTAVYVAVPRTYPGPAYGAALVDAMAAPLPARIAKAVAAGAAFEKWTASIEVPRSEWLVAAGDAVPALVAASTRHDLLIVDHAAGARLAAWDMPGLVLKSACPCIVLPRRPAGYQPDGCVAIAWNGSPEAARAVHSALPFLRGRRALLLRGEEPARSLGVVWHPPFDVEAYLVRHGVAVTSRQLSVPRDEVGITLLEEAARFGASLLVMGAYGRTRFSEWLLGGATRDALTWARMPVFLQH